MRRIALAALPAAVLMVGIVRAETVVETFRGDGVRNTRPFHVAGAWELQWDIAGYTAFEVHPASGGTPVAIASSDGGTGSSFVPTGGEFYLEITSFGVWQVKVVSLK